MEEMNEFETKPRGTFWRDWGVYGALALCLAIIGAAVAITSLPEKEEAEIQPTESIVTEPSQQDPLPVDKPVVAQETGLPVIRILPTVTAEPAPAQQAEAIADGVVEGTVLHFLLAKPFGREPHGEGEHGGH